MSRLPRSPTVAIRTENPQPDVLWNAIPDEHAVRVGRFLAGCALVEFKLEILIWHLIGAARHDLRPLTARLDARPKREAIDELLKRRAIPEDQDAAWEAAKPLLKQLAEHRSWLAHGFWVPFPLGKTSVVLTRKGKAPDVIARMKPITIGDLDTWIAQAADTVAHLNQLLPPDPDEQPPSPDRS